MKEVFLADTPALIRFYRSQTSPGWDETVTAGLVGLCEPVRQEYLRAVAGRADYYEADAVLHETFPHYEVPARTTTRPTPCSTRRSPTTRCRSRTGS